MSAEECVAACSSPDCLHGHPWAQEGWGPVAQSTFPSVEGKARTAWQLGGGGGLGTSSSKAHLVTPEVLVGPRALFSIPACALSP